MDVIRVLLDFGYDPNGLDENNQSPLHWALMHDNTELLMLLLDNGADNTLCYTTPRGGGKLETIRMLLDPGASVHSRDENGRTALHIAVSATNIEVIEVLLTAGADVAAKRKDGCTPLFEAVITSQSNVKWPSVVAIGKLIEFGADLNATNHEGKLVLHCLVDDARDLDDWEYRKTALSLLSNGINIGSRDSRGQTAKERTETLEKKDWIEFLANNEHYPRAA
ncbi:ankyrin [Lepidopterella palustris CBS 459.81]|uniref:Ankyrin n=1 Tax=Lepidopterella palustris CBS 459.81 TaxID=1314670 RepID=A0A8E2E8M1_9PEZI|nr:ankyrin [Lepidopterella palustris CBS 459.81]